jgi:methylmalonyl-CoA mutase
MSASTDPLPLAAEFPPASAEDWVELAAAALRRSGLPEDADPVEALTSRTYDGIAVRPLYTAFDGDPGMPGAPPYVRGATADGPTVAGWDVRQRHAAPDPGGALIEDLEGGATSLWLVLGPAGLPVDALPAALDGVYVDLAPIALDAGPETAAATAAFRRLVDDRGLDPAEVRGTLGADPIGLRARTGATADLGLLVPGDLPGMQLATVDGTIYHGAGAADADEVGIATAVGLAYLRALTDAGMPVERALDALEFRFAVTADQFASIAKLRAARQVWGRVAELCGATPARGQRQHAVTSAAMLTRRDPWVNILRATVACFAAAVGGADSVTVLPFDAALGLPDGLARRLARNTQAVLHDESSLGRVVDAGGGSWYVENFTRDLAEKAWDTFTTIERAGGAPAALDSGLLAALADRARTARQADIAHRRAPLTGVSEFALPDEPPVRRAPAPPPLSGGPLAEHRWAAGYEALRDAVEATDPRPTVYLAVLGPPAVHAARLGFARNLFQAAGFRLVEGPPEDAAGAVACLCSADKLYSADAVDALRARGVGHVWLAGKADVGADGLVFTGCDALDVLRTTADLLGVRA